MNFQTKVFNRWKLDGTEPLQCVCGLSAVKECNLWSSASWSKVQQQVGTIDPKLPSRQSRFAPPSPHARNENLHLCSGKIQVRTVQMPTQISYFSLIINTSAGPTGLPTYCTLRRLGGSASHECARCVRVRKLTRSSPAAAFVASQFPQCTVAFAPSHKGLSVLSNNKCNYLPSSSSLLGERDEAR